MRIASLIVVVVIAACGGGAQPVGGDSPEAAVRELASALDASAIRHAMISPDRLRKAVTCPSGNAVITGLVGALDHVDDAVKLMTNAKASVSLGVLTQTGTTHIAKGDNFRGCTANEPFELRSYSFKITITIAGHGTRDDDTCDVVQLDDRWFALPKD